MPYENEKTKIDVVKKIKIYKNKSGSMIEKRKPSVIAIRNNAYYDNNYYKQFQQNNKDSILKNSFNNSKMNNSISFGNNNFHLIKGSLINFKLKNHVISNDLKNIDNNVNELNSTGINLL